MKKALITGITGQDGSYLSELLLEKGYEVHGVVRRVALEDPHQRMWRIRHILDRLVIHSGSMESYASIFNIVEEVKPDECYHLAAQSFVSYSFEDEFSTIATNVNGTHYLLSAIYRKAPKCKFYFAGSSEMFGKVSQTPQDENTPFHPRSPYGISKVVGFDLTRNYREAYGLFAVSGILFNHESPRRGFEFVTRKITSSAAKIKLGLEQIIKLGNLDAKRDWGHAKDYVKAMWLMLQQDEPDDYVIATGKCHSVREFLEVAFGYVGLDYRNHIVIDKSLYRPAEVYMLQGNAGKAHEKLGWTPSVSFEALVKEMVDHDLNIYSQKLPYEAYPVGGKS
ncbi:MAG TPA: GDP-mannose 4,6-dehydratase [Syntrophaceae bacterium]|nr:GDP-mannose 4,6-dehydratase [Syntrophaceae bacterium]